MLFDVLAVMNWPKSGWRMAAVLGLALLTKTKDNVRADTTKHRTDFLGLFADSGVYFLRSHVQTHTSQRGLHFALCHFCWFVRDSQIGPSLTL